MRWSRHQEQRSTRSCLGARDRATPDLHSSGRTLSRCDRTPRQTHEIHPRSKRQPSACLGFLESELRLSSTQHPRRLRHRAPQAVNEIPHLVNTPCISPYRSLVRRNPRRLRVRQSSAVRSFPPNLLRSQPSIHRFESRSNHRDRHMGFPVG